MKLNELLFLKHCFMSEFTTIFSNDFKELVAENEELKIEVDRLKSENNELKELVGDDSMMLLRRLNMMNEKLFKRIDILSNVVKNSDENDSKDETLESDQEVSLENELKTFVRNFNVTSIDKIPSISSIDVSNVANFKSTFEGFETTSTTMQLSNWNVSKGTDFSSMFKDCKSLKNLEGLSHWDVSKGTDFGNMFGRCHSLEDISALSNWDVSNGTNFMWMFSDCKSLKNLEGLSHWDVSKGTHFYGMFEGCPIEDITPLVNWTVPEGYDVREMFDRYYPVDTDDLPNNISEEQIEWLNKNIKRHQKETPY